MRLIFHDTERYPEHYEEELIPVVWNFDPNLPIGEAAITFTNDAVIADIELFEELVPDWFEGMLADCPDGWGLTEVNGFILMVGVIPPDQTEITMLVLEKLGEFRKDHQ